MAQSCANCRFSDNLITTRDTRVACLRFPPQFHPLSAVQIVPHPLKTEWCGEWAARKGPVAASTMGTGAKGGATA